MKQISLTVAFLTLLSSALWSQKDISVADFKTISATGNIKVFLESGEKAHVKMYIDGIPEDEVTVKVSQGVLRLASLNSLLYKEAVIKLYVTYSELDEVRATAGAIVQSESDIKAVKFTVHAGSGAQVALALQVQDLDASVSEGGRVEVTGNAQIQDVSAATGGQYLGAKLQTQKTYVRSNTGARAEVKVETHLEVSANTGGEVIYYGNPETKYIKDLLGGEVRHGDKRME